MAVSDVFQMFRRSIKIFTFRYAKEFTIMVIDAFLENN